MNARIFCLLLTGALAAALTSCGSAKEESGSSSAPIAAQAEPSISEEPADTTGGDSEKGITEFCDSIDISGLSTITPRLKKPDQTVHGTHLSCLFWHEDGYIDDLETKTGDLGPRKEHTPITIYFNKVDVSQVIELSSPEDGYNEKFLTGDKSGVQILGRDLPPGKGYEYVAEAEAIIEPGLSLKIVVESMIERPLVAGELLPYVVDLADSITNEELQSHAVKNIVDPPKNNKARNLAEDTVLTGINGMLNDDPITVADYFDGGVEGEESSWVTTLFADLRTVPADECDIKIEYSRYSTEGSWLVMTDVLDCPGIYEDAYTQREFQKAGYMAWAVKRYPERDNNYSVFAKSEFNEFPEQARANLELNTMSVLPGGWSSEEREGAPPGN